MLDDYAGTEPASKTEFDRAVDEILEELRVRLIRDARARAVGECRRGGARRQWAEMVATLAALVPPGTMPAYGETWPPFGRSQPGTPRRGASWPGYGTAACAPRPGRP